MGKLALLAVVAFSTLGALMTMNRQSGYMDASEKVADKQYEVLARNGALAGYNLAKQALAEDFLSGTHSGAADGVDYSVVINVIGQEATIVSTGSIIGSSGEPVEYEIRADYQRILGEIPTDAPAFVNFAIASEGDLVLRGDIEGMLEVEGEDASELNANMHTNSDLQVMGNSARVDGFGTFVGTASGKLDETFNPNYNPTGLADAYQADAIEIPVMDIPNWISNVGANRTSSSNVVLSGTYSDGGTRDNPFIWVINGDLNVAGDAVMNGYTMFIVNGDVDFNANMNVGDSGFDGPRESSVAVYAAGAIDFTGNHEIEAQMYSEGDVVFGRGRPMLRGSVTTRSAVEFRGTPDIFFRSPSPSLTTNWVPRETMVAMTGYHEH